VCGIYGGVALGREQLRHPDLIEKMGHLLQHRGPDANGTQISSHAVFGAQRLRIIDPSPAADQPLTDPSERYWIVLNGAVYNAPELRRRYRDYPFKSRSDTEVVLPLFLDKGIGCVEEMDGMFALAIYDTVERTLLMARDRAGEKPLFYTILADEVWFASEIQALLSLPDTRKALDLAAVREFVTLGYVIEPKTMFQDIKRVRSGTSLLFTGFEPEESRYWTPACAGRLERADDDLVQMLESHLQDAVGKQLIADVPLGIFTSGGLDSALLVAMACKHAEPESISTYSVGFPQPEFDETQHATELARHFGTRHRTVVADEAALYDALRTIVGRVAEPSADPAILPTLVLARSASEHSKVIFGGEGADELFAGYPTYLGHRVAPAYNGVPAWFRASLDRLIERLPTSLESKVSIEYLIRRFLSGANLNAADRHMAWFGTGAGTEVLSAHLLSLEYAAPDFPTFDDPIRSACLFDYETYLRDNLLSKMDRATMLASIEARAPFLDRQVTEFAMGLDSSCKVRGLTTKWLLKKVARRWLPGDFVRRRKRGLSVPVAGWLNGGLAAEVERLLSQQRLEEQGLLHANNVRQLLSEHRSHRLNHGRALWALLMFQYWIERWEPEISL